jgi:hypothetical protein
VFERGTWAKQLVLTIENAYYLFLDKAIFVCVFWFLFNEKIETPVRKFFVINV